MQKVPTFGGIAPGTGQGRRLLYAGWRRRSIAARQASSSVDSADIPVLSVGAGLGNTHTSTTSANTTSPSTSLANSNSTTLTATPTTTLPSTTVAPSIPATPVLPTPFVQPFDMTLSTDFLSATCQAFFANLTQSLSFRQCRPFSLLYPTSQGFLSAQTNLTLLTAIIYGTCNTTPSEDDCVGRMDAFGSELQAQCQQELNAGHALTWDALNGMKNYRMMRDGACLQNARTDSYCFVDAVVATPPSDIYFYQLPLGTPLPGTSSNASTGSPASKRRRAVAVPVTLTASSAPEDVEEMDGGETKAVSVTPTCSACTQSLMAIYAGYATNSSLLISQTYAGAQRAVQAACGSGYASVVSAAASLRPTPFRHGASGRAVIGMVFVLSVALGLGL